MANPVRAAARLLDRRRLASAPRLRWWLIWGPPRAGTTLMHRLVAGHARLQVSDWGLRHLLTLPPEHDYIRFDRERYRRDLRRNILLNARAGGGRALDLAFKQAGLRPVERRGLEWLFGPPERVIFSLREPSGFMASARKKFDVREVAEVQEKFYLRTLEDHAEIGGDVFEYRDGLSMADYDVFLKPLGLPRGEHEDFSYRGSSDDAACSPEMWSAYETLRRQAANA